MSEKTILLDKLAPDGIKIGFEDLLSCQAACSGCTLTQDERSSGGLWEEGIARLAGHLAKKEVLKKAAIPGVREADLIGVQLFQGNHLLLPEKDIFSLVSFLAEIASGQSDIILSTSPVGNSRSMERGLDAFARARQDTGLSIDTALVFSDPRDYKDSVASNIERNTALIRERFDLTDVVVPVSADISNLPSPLTLHNIMKSDGYETLALALQPTSMNGRLYARKWGQITQWVEDVIDLWNIDKAYDLMLFKNVGQTIALVKNLELSDVVTVLEKRLRQQVFIGHRGAVHFMQEGLGGDDMPLSGRYGFAAAAHISDDDIDEKLDESARKTARNLWAGFLTNEHCSKCPHKAACVLSGVGQMRQAMGNHAATYNCPVGVRGLMDKLSLTVLEFAE